MRARRAALGSGGAWPWLALAALVLVSTAARAWAARGISVPWIAPDEMVYSLTGIDLYTHGRLEILGGPTPYYSLLVPAFVGLPLKLGGLDFGYGLLKVLQAFAMSLTAIPVFVWGRTLVRPAWALLAAGLTLAVPGLAYSGFVMTEVLFYPALTVAAWAMASALARPTPRAQALLVAAVVAAAAVRLQAIVLLPAFAGALLLHAALTRSWSHARRLLPALAALGAIAAVWFGWRLAAGRPVLGGYVAVTEVSYSVVQAAKFVVYHAASVLLLTGILPVCAVLVLLVRGLAGGERSPRAAALLAVAGSMLGCFVVEVGVFASQHVGALAERDLLALAPVLFLGFALWLERGGPGGYAVTAAVALGAAVVLLTLPLKPLVAPEAGPNAFTLIPLVRLRLLTSVRTMEVVFSIGVAVALLAFVLLPRRRIVLLGAVVLAALAAASVSASTYVVRQAELQRIWFLGPTPRWIDEDTNAPTTYVNAGHTLWPGVWQTVFWNRRVTRVDNLPGGSVVGPLPQHELDPDTQGRVQDNRSPQPAYAVAPLTVTLAGEPVTQIGSPGLLADLRLWRVNPPLRVLSQSDGLQGNGDIDAGGVGTLTGFGCRQGGTFLVTLLIKQPQDVVLSRNGVIFRRLRFPSPGPNEVWRGQIPAVSAGDGTCRLEVRPTGLLGTTTFTFQPA
jgi:hypothetical protein